MAEVSRFPGHLLVVDDNKVNRLLLTRALQQQGHTVESAENGRRALEMLQNKNFDLVLLDIEMPEMNGFQVLEQMMSNTQWRDIPVIVASSLEGLESVVKCIEMGAEDFLTKPVNATLLRARLNASLEKKRLRDQRKELIRRFATPEVAEDLEVTGFSLSGKIVDASVMFSDIRSFTTMAESQPPEETIDMLNDYYTLVFDAIGSHGGVVNQMMGDGLMSIFGAPIPQADHCERAVLAALEMIELIDGFNADRGAQGKTEIRIGIGIASGPVVAGYTGTTQRATYTCVGDTVNLAARLETHSKLMGKQILFEGVTRAALGAAFKVESHGLAQLKGKTIEVEVFSVPAFETSRSRADV
jgi:class 3 adenylate cyclase